MTFLIEQKEQSLDDELIRDPKVEVVDRKRNALKNLTNEKLVRQTLTEEKGKKYEPHSEKIDLAVKQVLEK